MGRGSYMGEAFSLSGILKIIEIILTFITVILHRHGGFNSSYVFFSTDQQQLQFDDQTNAIDAENLGNGTLVSYLIISPVILICYVLDGRYAIQSTFLEWFWNFLGACMFMGTGVKTLMVWTAARLAQKNELGGSDMVKDYTIGLAIGGLCVTISLVYFLDFIVAYANKRRFNRSAY